MKKTLKRNRKNFIMLILILISYNSVFAVNNIIVSNITNPAAANGTYIPQGILAGSGKNYWKHESQNYYIYYAQWQATTEYYWNIDVDTEDENGNATLFYSSVKNSLDYPWDVPNWSTDKGTGSVIVAEESATPEIAISGNGVSILSGADSPSISNYTEFQYVLVSSGTSTRTYSISNGGGANLTIGTISFSGSNASDFSVTSSPSASIASAGSSNFTVTFNPSGEGYRTATISIVNNDSDENPFTFVIKGEGFVEEDLSVAGITNPTAANGTYVFQGYTFGFPYWKYINGANTYYIYNDEYSGARYFNIDVNLVDDDGVVGNYTDDDGLFYNPSTAATPKGLTGWTLMSPSTGSPVITAAVASPEIDVLGNSISIVNGDVSPGFADHTHFGSLNTSSGTRSRTFTIQNTGSATLTLSGSSPYVSISGSAASDFSITSTPSNSIASGGSTTFTVTFDASAVGDREATLTLTNNDSNESTYTFNVRGSGFIPENIELSGVTTPSTANGVYVHQGILNEFQNWKFINGANTYYIYNDEYQGQWYWNIDPNTVDDDGVIDNTSDDDFLFAVSSIAVTPVALTGWSNNTAAGHVSAGTPVFGNREIYVNGNAELIIDGDATPSEFDHTDFGTTDVASGTIVRTFTIGNSGNLDLHLTDSSPYVTIGGDASSDFSVTSLPSSSISGGGTTTFQITFNPTTFGTRSATISIANDDSNENPYNFSIQGTGTAPEMNVQGNGTSIADDDVTPSATDYTDFGSLNVTSATISRAFTIQNTGNAVLNLSGTPKVAVSGTNSADFTVTTQPSSPVAATTGTTTFTVQFDPSGTGTRSATLSIGNNDNDENPYNFSIQGTGIVPPTVTTEAVSDITITTTTGNGSITDLGYPTSTTAYGICWKTSTGPVATDSHTDAGIISSTGAFTGNMTGLTEGTLYYVRAYATNLGGTSYGSEVTFTTLSPGTWTGITSTDWATATNWTDGIVPTSATDVIIPDVANDPIISDVTSADCRNLTIEAAGSLIISSTSSGTGSLIIHGTTTGNVSCERYLTASAWHMVSSPVSGQTIGSFLVANDLIAKKPGEETTRAMKSYNETTNLWNALLTNSSVDNMGGGNGFSVWPATAGTVTYSGTLQAGSKDVSVLRNGTGWNCIGNPYTSAIAINTAAGTDNFININSSNLEASYGAIYVWEQGNNAYSIISLGDDAAFYAQVGQGFFVKTIGAGNISFTSAIQKHQPTAAFKSAEIAWPEIKLKATLGSINSTTKIMFNEAMSSGLDFGYDAGMLKSGFDLYTKLVEDNGVDFGIQCLPLAANYEIVVPIGLESSTVGTVSFSAEISNLPTDCQVTLEDRETGVFTPLNQSGSIYNIQVAAKSKVTGRFFLHTSNTSTVGTTMFTDDWKIYTTKGQICISGPVTGDATATIYDLVGREIRVERLQKGSLNSIPSSEIRNGIYLLSIKQAGKSFTRKIPVNN